jgi:5-methylcytosine-specific restriction endonuclease McrA
VPSAGAPTMLILVDLEMQRGSNNERNVQILCRKCNLAKSDKI